MNGRWMMIVTAVCVAIGACTTPKILEVKTGPGTDYPCGVWGTTAGCLPNHCCGAREECCDGSRCPVDYCVPSGDEGYGGKSKLRRQTEFK